MNLKPGRLLPAASVIATAVALTLTVPGTAFARTSERPATVTAQPVDAGASVFSTEQQVIEPGLAEQITFNGVAYDTDAMFDDDLDVLVVNTPGRYLLAASVQLQFTPDEDGERELFLTVNGSGVAIDVQDTADGAGVTPTQTVSTIVQLDAGDEIALHAYQTTDRVARSQPTGPEAQPYAPRLQAELLQPAAAPPA
jgi:hypothetical protein